MADTEPAIRTLPLTPAEIERAEQIKRDQAINGYPLELICPVTGKTFSHCVDWVPPAFQTFVVARSPYDESGELLRCKIVPADEVA